MPISCCAVVKGMVTGCGGKLKAPVAKQKLFRIGPERRNIFPSRPEKGTILLFVEETVLRFMSLEIALFSPDFVHRKQRQTPQHPPPPPKKEKQ